MGNAASAAAIFAALPQCRGELKDADLALLETFARASDAERKELLSKFSPGTPQHGEMLAAVSEQLGYPKELEDILAAKIKEYGKERDEDYLPDWLRRYLFRKRMATLDPALPSLPTTDDEKKVRTEHIPLRRAPCRPCTCATQTLAAYILFLLSFLAFRPAPRKASCFWRSRVPSARL